MAATLADYWAAAMVGSKVEWSAGLMVAKTAVLKATKRAENSAAWKAARMAASMAAQ